MKLTIKTLANTDAGEIDLDPSIFDLEPRVDLLHRAVRYQLARRQSGNHKTKGISEIQGTTKKPYRQKGTGNARQGSKRAAQFRGGATIFGPVVRSHAHKLPKKVRALALRHALAAKARSGKLIVIDQLKPDSPKTKAMASALKGLAIDSAVFMDTDFDPNFVLATRNIPKIDTLPAVGANVYDILRRDTLVLSREAVTNLQERLK